MEPKTRIKGRIPRVISLAQLIVVSDATRIRVAFIVSAYM
jgi:hypothetical protein